MSTNKRQTNAIWLSALREIGFHISKIGDVITRCSEDAARALESDTSPPRQPDFAQRQSVDAEQSHDPRAVDPDTSLPSMDKYAPYHHKYPEYRFKYDHAPARRMPVYYHHSDLIRYGPDPHYVPHDRRDDMVMSDDVLRARKRRRSSPMSPPDPDRMPALSTEHPYPKDADLPAAAYPRTENGYLKRAPAQKGPRTGKRVRVNWTEAENIVFFNTILKHSTCDESALLREIVKALDGSRNWVQCKGHFRNMLVVGRIAYNEKEPKGWTVLDEDGTLSKLGAIKNATVVPKEDMKKNENKFVRPNGMRAVSMPMAVPLSKKHSADTKSDEKEEKDSSEKSFAKEDGWKTANTADKSAERDRQLAPRKERELSEESMERDLDGKLDDDSGEESEEDRDEDRDEDLDRRSAASGDEKLPFKKQSMPGKNDDMAKMSFNRRAREAERRRYTRFPLPS